jgi:hypothetical protein
MITTSAGIGIGSSEADLRRVYGDDMNVEPSLGSGQDFTVIPKDSVDHGLAIVFETDGHQVIAFRVGLRNVVRFDECESFCGMTSG